MGCSKDTLPLTPSSVVSSPDGSAEKDRSLFLRDVIRFLELSPRVLIPRSLQVYGPDGRPGLLHLGAGALEPHRRPPTQPRPLAARAARAPAARGGAAAVRGRGDGEERRGAAAVNAHRSSWIRKGGDPETGQHLVWGSTSPHQLFSRGSASSDGFRPLPEKRNVSSCLMRPVGAPSRPRSCFGISCGVGSAWLV